MKKYKSLFLFLGALIAFEAAGYAAETPAPLKVLGTTYSQRQSRYLAIDEKNTFLSILDKGFDVVRVAAYWDEIERNEDQYDFAALDWQIEEASKKGVPLVLAVGIKSPRWPEFFIPDWVMKKTHAPFGAELSAKNPFLRERTLQFIRTVVTRYKDKTIIRYWQVENEPLDRSGAKFWWIKRQFVKEEVGLVRALDDQKRPIIMTVATYPNGFVRAMFRLFSLNRPIPETMELGDIVGINVYHAIGQKFWNVKFYFWINPEQRAKYYSRIAHLAKKRGREVWITELQAEPWEPGQLVHTGKEIPPSGWPEEARLVFTQFQLLGFSHIFLWGAEYWQFREVRYQDTHWWDMVMGLMKFHGK